MTSTKIQLFREPPLPPVHACPNPKPSLPPCPGVPNSPLPLPQIESWAHIRHILTNFIPRWSGLPIYSCPFLYCAVIKSLNLTSPSMIWRRRSEKHLRICRLSTRIINRWTDTWSQWCIYDDGLFGQRHSIQQLQNKHLRETVKFYTTDFFQKGFFFFRLLTEIWFVKALRTKSVE